MAVTKIGRILYLDFRCYLPDGRKIRCRESTGLTDTKRNRRIAEDKDKAIKYHLRHGKFNYIEFFPHGSQAKHFRGYRPEAIRVSEFWDQWIEEKSIRRSSYKAWQSAFRVHICPRFGHMILPEVTEHEILVFRKLLSDSGLKASYINHRIIKPLCMMLRKAHKRGLLSDYPCSGISRLIETQPEIEPFNFDELRVFFKSLEKHPTYHDMILIWVHTGLRPGEIYALKWRGIDWFNRKIMIRESRSGGINGPPKTAYSERDIDMRPPVYQALKRQEARTGLMDGYVFLAETGKPFSNKYFGRRFRFLLRLAGLKYRPPVQLRHTFATLSIAVGENISWVSRMLGHSSVEMTLKKYNRFVPNLTREDGSLLEKILAGETRFGQNRAKADDKSLK